jgi:hypothetical protein
LKVVDSIIFFCGFSTSSFAKKVQLTLYIINSNQSAGYAVNSITVMLGKNQSHSISSCSTNLLKPATKTIEIDKKDLANATLSINGGGSPPVAPGPLALNFSQLSNYHTASSFAVAVGDYEGGLLGYGILAAALAGYMGGYEHPAVVQQKGNSGYGYGYLLGGKSST